MGALHPFEQALTLLLAFGPFVVLGIVVWLRRRDGRGRGVRLDRARGADPVPAQPASHITGSPVNPSALQRAPDTIHSLTKFGKSSTAR